MKKAFLIGIIMFLTLAVVGFADRSVIEEAITSYEAIVAEAEILAAKDYIEVTDFSALDEKAKVADEKVQAVTNQKEWIIEDAKISADLRARFNNAMAEIVQKSIKY